MSATPKVTTGTITSATDTVVLTKSILDTVAYIGISGTYTGVTLVIEGSFDATNYFNLPVGDMTTGATVVTGTITPGSSNVHGWRAPCDGIPYVRVRATGWSTGTANVVMESASVLGRDIVSATSVPSTVIAKKLELGPVLADVYAATNTIDVTYSYHVIAAANGTSAASTWTPSAAGTAGDILVLVTEADGSGTVTVTFASTFHSSGTQATTLSHFSSITFISDGTRWVEVCRTTALA